MNLSDFIDVSSAPASEIERILTLPIWRVGPDSAEAREIARGWDSRLSTGGQLRPVQGLALESAKAAGSGALLPIGVGYGKTLISLLLPRVLGIAPFETLILVPAAMRTGLVREARKRLPEFAIETKVHVASYAELSDPATGPDLLRKLGPKLIIADEAHYLKARSSARTRRVLRYFRDNPEARFVGMSGTLTVRSLRDYAHLSQLALRGGSPLPLPSAWSTLENWSACIDVDSPMNIAESWQWRALQRLIDWHHKQRNARGVCCLCAVRLGPHSLTAEGKRWCLPCDATRAKTSLHAIEETHYETRKEIVRDAFHERFISTPGVVHTARSALGTTLVIDPITDLQVPAVVREAMATARRDWQLPDGGEIDDPLALARALRQLATGFYYRWVWPGGEPDLDWLYARAQWSRAVRAIARLGREGMETERLIADAVRAGWGGVEIREAWDRWLPLRDRPEPPTEAVWLSDYLIRDAAERARKHSGSTIWYTHRAIADALALAGEDVVRPGCAPPEAVGADGRPLCLSIRSHGVGQNMQAWSRAFVLSPPVSGATWEQLLGRLHRPGQTADEVWFGVYAHTPEFLNALTKARADAEYIQRTQGQPQKLLSATWTTYP